MYSQILRRRVTTFEAAQKYASGTGRCPEAAFLLDLRPDFRRPQGEVAGRERDERRRSIGAERGENRILGGSDPALSGFSAAQRLRRRGSLPPKSSSKFPRSVARRPTDREPNEFESLTAEEMKKWH
jgi:hypothetical protein